MASLYGGVWKRLVVAFLLGWLLPAQVLHRLVRRYRQKLQDALPDTVDLLGRRDFFSPLRFSRFWSCIVYENRIF